MKLQLTFCTSFLLAILLTSCTKEMTITEYNSVRIKNIPRLTETIPAILYLTDQGYNLRAINASNGKEIWKTTMEIARGTNMTATSPVVYGTTVYAGTTGKIGAWDAITGTNRWLRDMTSPTTPMLYTDPFTRTSFLYTTGWISIDSSAVYALNPATGATIWTRKIGCKYIQASPLAYNGILYIGASNGNMYAIDALSGRIQWETNLGSGPVTSGPTVYNDKLYTGGGDGNLYALNTNTGKVEWKFETSNGIVSSPTVYADKVYFGGTIGSVYAVDAETGTRKWIFYTKSGTVSSPTINKGILYIGSSDGFTYAINATTGRELWRTASMAGLIEGNFMASPVVWNDIVFITDIKNYLYAFDAKGGYRLWTDTTLKTTESSPCLLNKDGTVYYPGIAGSHL